MLVTRSDKGLQFTSAVTIGIQGKDRALSLGGQTKVPAALNKLATVRLTGTLLKDADSNIVASYREGTLEFLIPQGLPKTAGSDAAAIWRTVKLSYKKAASDKAFTDVPTAEFVAFLPGGNEELRKICTDSRALEVVGGRTKGFAAHLEWLAAVIRAFPSDAAITPLEKVVEQGMRQRYEQFESGVASLEVLQQALQYAELSQAVYPKQPEQERLRKALADRKAWLDRRAATLRAFAVSDQWDAFLAGARDFETYERAFPEMAKLRSEALKQSLQRHRKAGQERLAEGEFGAAHREFRTASLRQPSNAQLQDDLRQSWTEYSRRTATDGQGRRETLSAGLHDAIERALYFADQNKQTKNLDEALKNVEQAEAILSKALVGGAVAPESRRVLYQKADILAAQGRVSEALVTLDQHDLVAIDDERLPASQLRNQLLFQLDKNLKEIKAQARKAWTEERFHLVRALSQQGLRAKDDDPELLHFAGSAAFVTRDRQQSQKQLARYLEVSNSLDGNAEQRVQARRLLRTVTAAPAPAAEAGEPNWMSGKRLPKNVFYCPVSLAFQPHIGHIDAGGKLKIAFTWEKARLKSIVPTFDKNEKPTGEKWITFGYDERVPQVASVVAEQAAPPPAGADPDEAVRRAALMIPNNPYVDPAAVQALTGKNITLGIAGNRFFNPFVWDKVYYFRFTYDEQGRVSQARELSEPGGAAGTLVVEFDWNGLQLAALRGYEGPDEKRRVKIYERTLQYEGGRLMSEDIQSQGRSAKVKYTYKGDTLVSASCDKGAHLDARARQVTFAGN
ncbi:MAG: hypothetical protein Q8N47_26050 [Bryobacterales bacterium]|nr:hypothetical protein [Bryobacterales bacterium]